MALTYCDMTTGPTGEVITYEERLAGMERRHGAEHKELHFLTAAQVEALAEVIAPPYGTLIRVVGYTGLRPCEFVALKVGRLDLPRGTVRVAEAAPEVAGHLEWGGVNTP